MCSAAVHTWAKQDDVRKTQCTTTDKEETKRGHFLPEHFPRFESQGW